jgi:hypothetical protein
VTTGRPALRAGLLAVAGTGAAIALNAWALVSGEP